MNEMVERVAKAIERTMFADHELPITGELHDRYLETARAAIEVMYMPTKPMILAVPYSPEVNCITVWKAMIDAAVQGASHEQTKAIGQAMIVAALAKAPSPAS